MQLQTISVLTVAQIIAAAEVAGLPAAPLWSIVGGDHPIDLDRQILATDHYALWEAIMRQLRSPAFPITYARRISIDHFDVLGFAAKTADDLAGAVDRFVRYHRIWTTSSRWQVRADATRFEMVFVREGPRALGLRCATEAALAEAVQLGRQIAGPDVQPLRVRFTHPAPADTRAHAEHFAAPLEFAAGRDSVEYPAALMRRPLLLRDAAMARFFARQLDQRVDSEPSLRDAVDALVRAALPDGPPSMQAIARKLGLSPRTLHRRLAELGTSYQAVFEDTRRALAEQLVRDPRHPLAEVAFMLGFAELRGFYRAFRRWTGQTPAVWRSGLSAGARA